MLCSQEKKGSRLNSHSLSHCIGRSNNRVCKCNRCYDAKILLENVLEQLSVSLRSRV